MTRSMSTVVIATLTVLLGTAPAIAANEQRAGMGEGLQWHRRSERQCSRYDVTWPLAHLHPLGERDDARGGTHRLRVGSGDFVGHRPSRGA